MQDIIDSIKESDNEIFLEFENKSSRLERELGQLNNCKRENKKDMASARQRVKAFVHNI